HRKGTDAVAERPMHVPMDAVADNDRYIRPRTAARERGRKGARVPLHVAVYERGDRCGDEALQLEVRLKRRQTSLRVGDEADAEAGIRQRTQHVRDIVVQLEMLARGPFGVDLARTGVDVGTAPAHLLDDVTGVGNEDVGVV